jgi:hypothetical protein
MPNRPVALTRNESIVSLLTLGTVKLKYKADRDRLGTPADRGATGLSARPLGIYFGPPTGFVDFVSALGT